SLEPFRGDPLISFLRRCLSFRPSFSGGYLRCCLWSFRQQLRCFLQTQFARSSQSSNGVADLTLLEYGLVFCQAHIQRCCCLRNVRQVLLSPNAESTVTNSLLGKNESVASFDGMFEGTAITVSLTLLCFFVCRPNLRD